jgi:small subunit ribosomal protein S5
MSEQQRGERAPGRSNDRSFENRERSELVDKLVGVRRVAKTVKGGRRMAFGALVIVGDEAGRVGFGQGKAKEVPEAVRKATEDAKRSMVRVPLRQGRTMHHEIAGRFGATRVVLKPAMPGTGIIAGGPMRAVFEAMGIKDVVAKALGSTNPYNLIRATFAAFAGLETPRGIAAKRGLQITDLTLHKEQSSKGELDQKELLARAELAKKAKAARMEKADARRAGGRGGDKGGAQGGARGRRDEARSTGRRDAGASKVVTVTKDQSMQAAVAATDVPTDGASE